MTGEEMDKAMKPYAKFLEDMCRFCAEEQPISGTFLAKNKDGDSYSIYFGEGTKPGEKMSLGNIATVDAIYQIIMANADKIVDHADEIENEEE